MGASSPRVCSRHALQPLRIQYREVGMRELNHREMRASIGPQAPSHADLRQRMAQLQTTSAELTRSERDARQYDAPALAG